jgi:hypothetical protein
MKLKLIMPSEGDMELATQDGGTIVMNPIFYGSVSMGPHIQVLDDDNEIQGRYKITVSSSGKLKLEKQKEMED